MTQSLIEILDNVVDVLDTDAEPNHLWTHTRLRLFLRRHLTMGRRGGMAGKRLDVADVDQPFEEFERIVTYLAGRKAALDAKR